MTFGKLEKYKHTNPHISFGVVFVIFILCPIASLPFILRGCYRNDRRFYVLASFFLGICALLLFLPIADQYRHATHFYKLKGEPWLTYYLLSIANGQIDFIVNYLLFLANEYSLPFGIVRTALTVLCSFLFLNLYDNFCIKFNLTFKQKQYIFWLLFFIFPMSAICTGLRFATSICLILYVLCRWNIFRKRDIFDYILLAIAVFTHTAGLIPLLIYLCSMIMPNKLSRKFIISAIITAIILSTSFYLVLQYLPLPDILSSYVQRYTEGKFANSEYITAGANIIGLVQTYVGLYGSLTIIIYTCITKYHYNKNTKLIYLLIIVYFLTLNMFSLNGRIGLVITIYGGFLIIDKWRSKIKSVTISLLCLTLFLQLFSWRKIKYYNLEYLFTPIVFVLDGDYDETWIEENVNSEGTIRDYW